MISQLLGQRHEEGRPIRVGIIGTGKFGGGLAVQISRMRGMRVAAIADISLENAHNRIRPSVPCTRHVSIGYLAQIQTPQLHHPL